MSFDDQYFSGSESLLDPSHSQGRLAPAPTTHLPSQLLLLDCKQADPMASMSVEGPRDSWVRGPLPRERRYLWVSDLPPCRVSGQKLVACGPALFAVLE